MTIGENIRKARKKLHMSQEELADAIGSNRVTISKYENGDYLPSVPALGRLAEALRTTASELSGDRELEGKENLIPQTDEVRIISVGIDKLPKEQREQTIKVMQAVFSQYADYFEKGNNDDET